VKVIFVDDVPNVARVGQTKEVANGYARNFLFPRKLAVLANSQAAASIDAHLKKVVKLHAVEEAKMAELAAKINGMEITLRAKVGENDKLYGSITAADIAEALSKAAGTLIDKKHIAIAEPIKMAGICDVTIKFMHDISAVIKTCVIDENAVEEDAIKAAKAAKAEKKAKADAAAAEKAAKPAKEKKPKAEKVAEEETAEKPAAEVKAAKPAKGEKAEKAPKAEKADVKAEKPAKEKKAKAEPAAVVEEEKPAKAEKPAKEKKAKAEKAVKEEAPAAEEAPVAEKKEKKPRKAKKEEAAE
jgi:large subunit ribosomal protein L9